MSKYLQILKRRKPRSSSLPVQYDAHGNQESPKLPKDKSSQAVVHRSGIIFTFGNENVLKKKKCETRLPGTEGKGKDNTSPRLLLPIVIVLGWRWDVLQGKVLNSECEWRSHVPRCVVFFRVCLLENTCMKAVEKLRNGLVRGRMFCTDPVETG